MMLVVIIFFTFITAFLLVFGISRVFMARNKSILRLKNYSGIEEDREETKRSANKENKVKFALLTKGVGNAKFLDQYKKKVQFQLNRAHLLLKAEEYISFSIILCLISAISAFIMFAQSDAVVLFCLIAGILGWFAPMIFVKVSIAKRMKLLNDQLSDAIVLISNSLKAGYSFFQAVDIVAKEMNGPIAEEFSLMQKEINLGVTTENALENLVGRVMNEDLELIVTAVLIQRQVGGNLAEVLDNIANTIRERVRIKDEVKTVTAQGKASGIIIALLPPILGFLLYLINKEHISLLFTDPLGIAILVFSIFMELIGIYFISQIVKIEV